MMNDFEKDQTLTGTLEGVIESSAIVDELPLEEETDEFFSPLSPQELIKKLQKYSEKTSSIQAKSRALLVTARLQNHQKNHLAAESTARTASAVAPKSALAALFHRKILRQARTENATDAIVENLHAITAGASSGSARVHSSLCLAKLLSSQGSREQASQVLDNIARSGIRDIRVDVERIVDRLASNSNVAGLTNHPQLKASAALAQEICNSQISSTTSPLVSWLRCARALAQGRVFEAGGYLVELAKVEDDAVITQSMIELAAQLLSVRAQGRPHALALLKSYHKQLSIKSIPIERSLLRLLARVAVEQDDISALNMALATADPAGGTFEESERLLLLKWTQSFPILSAEEQEALEKSQPMLTWLSPLKDMDSTEVLSIRGPLDERQRACLATQIIQKPKLLSEMPQSADEGETRNQSEQDRHLTPEEVLLQLTSLSSLRLEMLSELTKHAEDEESLAEHQLDSTWRHYAATLEKIAGLIDEPRLALLAASTLLVIGNTEDVERAELKLREILDSDQVSLRLAAYRALDFKDLAPGQALDTLLHQLPEDELKSALKLELSCKLEGREQIEILKDSDYPAYNASRASALNLETRQLFHQLIMEDDLAGSAKKAFQLRAFLQLRLDEPEKSLTLLLEEISKSQTPDDEFLWLAATWASHDQNSAALLNLSERLSGNVDLIRFIITELLAHGQLQAGCKLLFRLTGSAPLPLLADLGHALGHYDQVFQLWSERARTAEEQERNDLRLHCFERLAEIDKARGEIASANLWRRSIAEVYPKHLPSLFEWEEQLFSEKNIEAWPPLGERLAQASLKEEAAGYEELALLLLLGSGQERRALKRLINRGIPLQEHTAIELQLLYHSNIQQVDSQATCQVLEELFKRSSNSANSHFYALKAGESASRLGEVETAHSWFSQALQEMPESGISQLNLARQAHQNSTSSDEGVALLQLSSLIQEPSVKLKTLLHAGELQHQAGLIAEAEERYRDALTLQPENKAAYLALEKLIPSTEHSKLVDLRQERLTWVDEAPERFHILLLLTQDLKALNRLAEAKNTLEQALELQPDSLDALELHRELSQGTGDFDSALSSLEKLKSTTTDDKKRVDYQREIAAIYLDHQQDLKQAMQAYEQVLILKANDQNAMSALVDIFSSLDLGERATRLQTKLLQNLTADTERIEAVIKLALLYEKLTKEPVKAGATLEKARKVWPQSPEVLEALAHFMVRNGDEPAKRMLIDRSFKEAIRQLETAQLDPRHFSLLAKLAALNEHAEMARCVEHARASLLGDAADFKGVGLKALSSEIEAALSNEIMSNALLSLFKKVGPALEHAFPLDTTSLKPIRITDGPILQRIQEAAKATFGTELELYSSSALGDKMVPFTASPPRLIVGENLEQLSSRAFDFALVRCLKVMSLGAIALCRSNAPDAWAMIAATLTLFSPNYQPEVEQRKLSSFQALIEQGLAKTGYDADVPIIALEALGSLPQNPEVTLPEAVVKLGYRCALLAVGRISAALEVLQASQQVPVPPNGAERLTWLEKDEFAKDLIKFSCSRKYAELRLGPQARKSPSNFPEAIPRPHSTPTTTPPRRRAPPGRLPPRSRMPLKPKE